jgi:post-segregation antitoxin (ccd killing protein)
MTKADALSLALERAARIMAGTVTYVGYEKQLARALIELWQQGDTEAVKAINLHNSETGVKE